MAAASVGAAVGAETGDVDIRGEVHLGERVLPVRHAGRHDAFEVGEDRLHVRRLFRR